MIVLMGASGNVGSQTARILLEHRMRVRVIGRHTERLRPLADLGADIAIGDVLDSEFLQQAFQGAGAAFVMTPQKNDAENVRSHSRYVSDSVIAALKGSGITHVVHLSSHGAHLAEGTGPVKGLHDQEQRLNSIPGINVLHLRPTYFMENLLASIPMIKHSGMMGGAIKGDVPFAMIATRDIAPVAAEALMARNFTGVQIRELLGERDATLHETARVFGALIGKDDLSYVTFTYDDMREGLRRTGYSDNAAKETTELARAINDRLICVNQPRNSLNTTHTSIESFAPTFAAVYHAT